MLRPVMPTWRARGSQPLSVTLRVAASSAPSASRSGSRSGVLVGRHALTDADDDGRLGEHVEVVVAGRGRGRATRPRGVTASSRRRRGAVRARCELAGASRRARSPSASASRAWIAATSWPPNAGFHATSRSPSSSRPTASPVSPAPSRGRGAARDLATPRGARREDRPRRRRRAAQVDDARGDVLLDARRRASCDDRVGAPRSSSAAGVERRGRDRDGVTADRDRRGSPAAPSSSRVTRGAVGLDEHARSCRAARPGRSRRTAPRSRGVVERGVERAALRRGARRRARTCSSSGRVGQQVAERARTRCTRTEPTAGRARGLAPRSRAEVGGGHAPDAVGGDRGAPVGVDLARVDEPLGGREHRRAGRARPGPSRRRARSGGASGRGRRARGGGRRWRTGRSSSSASSGPTWPVSASTELRPTSTRSNGPSRCDAPRRARARSRACRSRRTRDR